MSSETQSAQAEKVVLQTELLLSNIGMLKSQLRAALQSTGTVEVNIADVKVADTASLQLLAAFKNEIDASDQDVQWCGFSEALLGAAILLGLDRHLALLRGENKAS